MANTEGREILPRVGDRDSCLTAPGHFPFTHHQSSTSFFLTIPTAYFYSHILQIFPALHRNNLLPHLISYRLTDRTRCLNVRSGILAVLRVAQVNVARIFYDTVAGIPIAAVRKKLTFTTSRVFCPGRRLPHAHEILTCTSVCIP